LSLVTPRKGYKSVPWLFGKEIEIPEEWEVKKFEDIAKIRRGASPRPIEDSKYFGKGRGWIRISDVTKSKKYLKQTTDFLSDLGESKSVAVNDGDVILSIAASVGKPIIIKMKACIHDGFITFTNMSNTMNNEFLYYLLLKTKSTFTNIGQHGTQSNINSEIVSKTNFLNPPLHEQQKIATILSNVDNLIESTGKVITHSKKVKTGLMQKLLTRGIGHTKFKKVPWLFGREIEIPEEWEVRKLDSLVTLLTNGFVGKAKEHYTESENGVLYIQGYNIEENNFKFHGIKYVTPQFHKQQQKSNLQLGDLLTVQTGNVGTTAIISKSLVGANCHALIISRFKKEIADSDYFCQYFNSRLCQKSFKSIEIGTSLKHLNGSDMKRLQFVLPPLPEQQKIASILSNVDSKITSQEQYKENLERLKKSLMQKLLTGEIRV